MSMVTITSAVGEWSLLTASFALFVGIYLGVLTMPITTEYAVVAGLVIWALFFLSLVILEYKAVTTVVGGLIHSAVGGLRNSAGVASTLFTPSKSKSIENQTKIYSCHL